jgi:hypothetical protein
MDSSRLWGCSADSRGSWFIFVPPRGATYVISTTNVNSVVNVFSGNNCRSLLSLSCGQRVVSVNLVGSTLYYVRISATTIANGTVSGNLLVQSTGSIFNNDCFSARPLDMTRSNFFDLTTLQADPSSLTGYCTYSSRGAWFSLRSNVTGTFTFET